MEKLHQFSVGSTEETLPNFIKLNRGLKSFVKDYHGKPFEDNKCFFRCLASHKGSIRSELEADADNLFALYCNAYNKDSENFQGVSLDELPKMENLFKIDIWVYSLTEESDGDHPAVLYQRGTGKHVNKIRLNLYQNHFSLITDLSLYSSSFTCRSCEKAFTRSYNL